MDWTKEGLAPGMPAARAQVVDLLPALRDLATAADTVLAAIEQERASAARPIEGKLHRLWEVYSALSREAWASYDGLTRVARVTKEAEEEAGELAAWDSAGRAGEYFLIRHYKADGTHEDRAVRSLGELTAATAPVV